MCFYGFQLILIYLHYFFIVFQWCSLILNAFLLIFIDFLLIFIDFHLFVIDLVLIFMVVYMLKSLTEIGACPRDPLLEIRPGRSQRMLGRQIPCWRSCRQAFGVQLCVDNRCLDLSWQMLPSRSILPGRSCWRSCSQAALFRDPLL